MDSRLYWIWLQRALGPGNPHVDPLLRIFGDARGVYNADHAELRALGFTGKEYERLTTRSVSEAAPILKRILSIGGWVMTPESELYPPLLRNIFSIPLALYGVGKMPDLNALPSITVVGTREISYYGIQATSLIAGGLALGGAVVVSGGARGGDAAAHHAAMEVGGITVAIQACGLDVNYPVENKLLRRRIIKTGALISEFLPGLPAYKHHFGIRNRILSGMTLGTCVTESPYRSGTQITAHHALEQGKDVFAVAGDMITGRSEGTDALICEGAQLVRNASEILEYYRYDYSEILDFKAAESARRDARLVIKKADIPPPMRRRSPPPDMDELSGPVLKVASPGAPVVIPPKTPYPEHVSDNAKRVYDAIGDDSKLLDAIITISGLDAKQTMVALTELEIQGCIRCLPGKCYERA